MAHDEEFLITWPQFSNNIHLRCITRCINIVKSFSWSSTIQWCLKKLTLWTNDGGWHEIKYDATILMFRHDPKSDVSLIHETNNNKIKLTLMSERKYKNIWHWRSFVWMGRDMTLKHTFHQQFPSLIEYFSAAKVPQPNQLS